MTREDDLDARIKRVRTKSAELDKQNKILYEKMFGRDAPPAVWGNDNPEYGTKKGEVVTEDFKRRAFETQKMWTLDKKLSMLIDEIVDYCKGRYEKEGDEQVTPKTVQKYIDMVEKKMPIALRQFASVVDRPPTRKMREACFEQTIAAIKKAKAFQAQLVAEGVVDIEEEEEQQEQKKTIAERWDAKEEKWQKSWRREKVEGFRRPIIVSLIDSLQEAAQLATERLARTELDYIAFYHEAEQKVVYVVEAAKCPLKTFEEFSQNCDKALIDPDVKKEEERESIFDEVFKIKAPSPSFEDKGEYWVAASISLPDRLEAMKTTATLMEV